MKNAFLNVLLQETVYIAQPPGFKHKQHPQHVCKLNKALYRLKQAPRAWYDRFNSFLISKGFLSSQADPSLFALNSDGALIILLLYVDDMLVTGS